MSEEQAAGREHPLKDKLEEIGRRLTEQRSREELEEIQLELQTLQEWDKTMLKAADDHDHDHDFVTGDHDHVHEPVVVDMGEVDP
jgi:hypothetical protein